MINPVRATAGPGDDESAEASWRYLAEIAAAAAALERGDAAEARRSLDAAPEAHRDWEWHYLAQQIDTSVATLPAPFLRNDSASLAFSPDGVHLMASDNDQTVLWDVSTRAPTAPIAGRAIGFSGDGSRLALRGTRDGRGPMSILHDVRRRAVVAEPAGTFLRFSPDGRLFVAAEKDAIVLYRSEDGSVHATLPVSVRDAVFSPDGTFLATRGDHAVDVWQVFNAEKILSDEEHHIAAVAFSPDGRVLATGSSSTGEIRLWSIPDRSMMTTIPSPVRTGVAVLALSESRDVPGLVSALHLASLHPNTGGPKVQLWRLPFRLRGAAMGPFSGTEGHGLAFGPRGNRMLVIGHYGRPCLVSTIRGETVSLLEPILDGRLPAPDHAINVKHYEGGWRGQLTRHVRFRPDAAVVAALAGAAPNARSQMDRQRTKIRLWHAESGAPITTLHGHAGRVIALDYSPDGAVLASAAHGEIRLWAPTAIVDLVPAPTARFDPTGRFVAFETDDAFVTRDLATGRTVSSIVLAPRVQRRARVGLGADWSRGVAVVPEDRSTSTPAGLAVFDPRDDAGPTRLDEPRTNFEISPDGARIAVLVKPPRPTPERRQTWPGLRLRDGADGGEIVTFTEVVWPPLFAPDGASFVVRSPAEHEATLHDAETGAMIAPLAKGIEDIGDLAFSENGETIVGRPKSRTVAIWDARTGAALARWKRLGARGSQFRVALSPDGARVAAAYDEHGHGAFVRVWHRDRPDAHETYEGLTQPATLRFDPTGRRLALGAGPRARIWDVERSTVIVDADESPRSDFVGNFLFSPDGRRVVLRKRSDRRPKRAAVWDLDTGARVAAIDAFVAGFNPAGTRLVTVLRSGALALVDPASGRQTLVLRAVTGNVPDAYGWATGAEEPPRFSADGRRIMARTDADVVQIWGAAPPTAARAPDG